MNPDVERSLPEIPEDRAWVVRRGNGNPKEVDDWLYLSYSQVVDLSIMERGKPTVSRAIMPLRTAPLGENPSPLTIERVAKVMLEELAEEQAVRDRQASLLGVYPASRSGVAG